MKSTLQSLGITLLTIFVTVSVLAQSPPLVTIAASDFEVDADGWLGTNNLGGSESLRHLAGGATSDSVGYISVSEATGDSALLYFFAPAKYLGDKRAAYNGLLRLRFKQSATSGTTTPNRFVVLGSTSAMLSFDLPTVPAVAWQTIIVPLHESAGWHVASPDGLSTSYQLATRDDFIAALRSMDRLMIRAEFSSNNADRSDLDDVALLAQPSGPVQPILAAATYAGVTVDGAVGASYRIEYRASFGGADEWQKLSDIVLPTSPYLFIDRSSPSASRRLYRAVLNP